MREVPARLLFPYNSRNNLKYYFIQENHKTSFETVKVYFYLICIWVKNLYMYLGTLTIKTKHCDFEKKEEENKQGALSVVSVSFL